MGEAEIMDYKGFKIIIEQYENPEDPRQWDNLGTMLAVYRGYDLGDEPKITPEGIIDRIFGSRENYREGKVLPGILALPLIILDHSGLWMRVGSPFTEDLGRWDTSMVGFIYVTHERILQEYGKLYMGKYVKAKAETALRAEVSIYSDYLSGDVVGFIVEDKDGEHIDSCWGYYGQGGYNEAVRGAKQCIDSIVDGELYKVARMEQLPLFKEEVAA